MNLNSEQRRIIDHLEQIEEAGEIVLSKQQECVIYDRNRQKSREAVRYLMKSTETQWVCLSNQFFQLPADGLYKALEADIGVYDSEIQNLKTQLKEDVNWLYELEGKEKLKGFDLISIAKNDTGDY